MKVGVTLFAQNYTDWDRFEAIEAGVKDVPPQGILDAQIYQEQFKLGDMVEPLGFDSSGRWNTTSRPTHDNNPTSSCVFRRRTKRIDMGTMVVCSPGTTDCGGGGLLRSTTC